MSWEEETVWEKQWWNNCVNSYTEETKQFAHANLMGLKFEVNHNEQQVIDMQGRSVLDIGGGPTSLLLKCVNVKGFVADPCDYPEWVYQRYAAAGIGFFKEKGEDLAKLQIGPFDEVWMYNLLQHVEDPQRTVWNALALGKIVRISDFPYTRISPGHPNSLDPKQLDEWFGGEGKITINNSHGINGYVYHGIFKGEKYA